MKGEQPEVDQRAGRGLAVDADVALGQVPAARAHEQRRRIGDELIVAPVGGVVGDRRLDRVDQVRLSLDLLAPCRRVRILEVGHEATGTGVQGVDDELAVSRAGDLDAAVQVVRTGARGAPVAVADLRGLGQEPTGRGSISAGGEQLPAAAVEALMELLEERDRLLGEDRFQCRLAEAVEVEGHVACLLLLGGWSMRQVGQQATSLAQRIVCNTY
jgi:hypothetical protein